MSSPPSLLLCAFETFPNTSLLSSRLDSWLVELSTSFQVVVVSLGAKGLVPTESWKGARHLRVPVPDGDVDAQIEAFSRALIRQAESESPSLAHAFDPVSGAAVAKRKARGGYRLLVETGMTQATPSEVEQRQKVSLAASDFCLAQTSEEVARLESLGVHASRIGLVPSTARQMLDLYLRLAPASRRSTPPPLPARASPTVASVKSAAPPGIDGLGGLMSAKTDFWLGQALWGYCPPPQSSFARHAPPTTFAGNDEFTQPSARLPSPGKKDK